MAKYPSAVKRDVVTVARRSDAAYEELASDFGFSVNSLRRWIKQADVADGLTLVGSYSRRREVGSSVQDWIWDSLSKGLIRRWNRANREVFHQRCRWHAAPIGTHPR